MSHEPERRSPANDRRGTPLQWCNLCGCFHHSDQKVPCQCQLKIDKLESECTTRLARNYDLITQVEKLNLEIREFEAREATYQAEISRLRSIIVENTATGHRLTEDRSLRETSDSASHPRTT